MEQRKVLKKLIASLLLAVLFVTQFSSYNFESIAKATPVSTTENEGESLTLSMAEGDGENSYIMPVRVINPATDAAEEPIYRLVQHVEGSEPVYSSNLYCIRAGHGATWNTNHTANVVYDIQSELDAIKSYTYGNEYKTTVTNNFNKILWVIDHMIIPGEDDENEIKRLLETNVEIDFEEDFDGKLITNEDILAVQQAAIWYFTNPDRYQEAVIENPNNIPTWLKYNGTQLDQKTPNGDQENAQAMLFYTYLINGANDAPADYTLKNTTVKLWQKDAADEQPVIEIHRKVKTGLYDIVLVKEDENGADMTATAKFKVATGTANVDDATEIEVTGRLTIADDVQITRSNLTIKDRYTIKETVPPDEYCEFDGIIHIEVTKKETDTGYEVDEVKYTVFDEDGNDITEERGEDVKVYLNENGNIYVEVKNYPVPKPFDLALRKAIVSVKDSDGVTKTVNNARELNTDGSIKNIDKTTLNNEDDDSRTDTATYKHRKDPVVVEKGDIIKYSISVYNEGLENGYATKIVDQLPGTAATALKLKMPAQNTVTSTKGNTYRVECDANNKVTLTLTSENPTAIVAYDGTTLDYETILLECEVVATPDSKRDIILTNIAYIFEEYNVATGQTITNSGDRDSNPNLFPTATNKGISYGTDLGYKGNSSNKADLTDKNYFYKGQQDDDDFDKIVIKPKAFDLKLVKYISAVNLTPVADRLINVDTSKLDAGIATTATYTMDKVPVLVQAGDFVTYTIRVYNEGDYDGYAKVISDEIPDGLEAMIKMADDKISAWDGETIKDITDELSDEMKAKILAADIWTYEADSKIIKTMGLDNQLIKAYEKDGKLDYKEVTIIFRVKQDAPVKTVLRNEAAITEDQAKDKEGNVVNISDRDSSPQDWNKENTTTDYNGNSGWMTYKEDDEDYDNIILKVFDLSLRKQVVDVNDVIQTSREATLITGKEDNKVFTTGSDTKFNYYQAENNPVKVKAGDIVTYSIVVYNEGEVSGYAKEIADTIPEGLEFVPSNNTNKTYKWVMYDKNGNVTQDVSKATMIKTDYLSYENDVKNQTIGTAKTTLLTPYNEIELKAYAAGNIDTMPGCMKVIYVVCKVKDNVTKTDSLLNVAQISDDSDANGNDINDVDSIPGDKDGRSKWKDEDDLDIDVLKLQEFDLALRKFITKVEGEEVTTRVPELSYDKAKNKITYTHTKEPLTVHVGDTVIYTLRIFNEGDIDGYAKEITDNIPEYLEFLPENDVNKTYKWVMYDKDGNVTDDVSKAYTIRTSYLSKENEKTAGEFLLKAFNPEKELSDTNPSHLDVKVAFKVKDPGSNEYIIKNFAEISDDSDEYGRDIEDRDSRPGNGDYTGNGVEDDEDIENVKVEYFDLALVKYVTKALVTEDGKTKTIETGNKGVWGSAENVPKVVIEKSKINKVSVKFEYTIRVTNEGDVEGYAKEIKDHIPEGLKFVAADNKDWKDEGNNIISTRLLENTLLKPGESAEVTVILTWVNGKDNMGKKRNYAEISEDYNEKGLKDRDSTPDNFSKERDFEDDEDFADIVLEPKTGIGLSSIYTNVMTVLIVIILSGVVLIKKFIM